jgi:hypothetical protein
MATKKSVKVTEEVTEEVIETVVETTEDAVDPVIEAQNLLLEIDQAEQDIADVIAADMVRAEIEHKAIIAKNLKESNRKRDMDIHMASKSIKLAEDTLKQAKNGLLTGRYLSLVKMMYELEKEDIKLAKEFAKRKAKKK